MQTVDFRHFEMAPGDRVLDLGCGEGRHVISVYLQPGVQAVGVDLSLDDLNTTREKFAGFAELEVEGSSFNLASANALSLPFPDHCFDKVICSEVLEHIPDYPAALLEIYRVLKPGGSLSRYLAILVLLFEFSVAADNGRLSSRPAAADAKAVRPAAVLTNSLRLKPIRNRARPCDQSSGNAKAISQSPTFCE